MEGGEELKNKEERIIYKCYNSKIHKLSLLFWRRWGEDTNDVPCQDT